MRVALVIAALTSFTTGIVLLACSSETPAPASGGTSGTVDSGSDETSLPTFDSGEGTEDGSKIPYSPTGCRLYDTDYRIGAKAENVKRPQVPDAVDWENVEGAKSEDGNFAKVVMGPGQTQSAELRVSDFKMDLPATYETWGIEVELKRRSPTGAVLDAVVDIVVEGKPSTFKYVGTPWPTTIVGVHHYGQPVDTWGVDLFPEDVNKPTFAAKLIVKRAGDAGAGDNVEAIVDSLKIAVYFCKK